MIRKQIRFPGRVQWIAIIAICMFSAPGYCATQSKVAGGTWKIEEGANSGGPGNKVEVKGGGKLGVRLIYGPGKLKPYLHVFGEDGELLTNGGLDAQGKPTGQFPH